jgi:hypothetical protein
MPRVSATKIEDILSKLINSEVLADRKAENLHPEEGVFAVFGNEKGNLIGTVAMDFELANYIGGDLTDITNDAVQEAVENRELSETVEQNVEEICQVTFGRFVLNLADERSNLTDLYAVDAWSTPPQIVNEAYRDAISQVTFEVELPKYDGSGRVEVVSL